MRLALRVQPGARRSALLGPYGDRLRLAVKAPPVDGRANAEVIKVIADLVGVSRRSVSLSAGHGGRDKRVTIAATLAEVRAAVAQALERPDG